MANTAYISTIQGMLKLAIMGLSLICFICAIVPYYSTTSGGGWNQFVAIITLIVVTGLFLIYFLDMTGRIPSFPLLELIAYAVLNLFNFIAFCVACYLADRFSYFKNLLSDWGALVAAAIFFLIVLVLLIMSAFFAFRDWRAGTSTETSVSKTTTITTTTTVAA